MKTNAKIFFGIGVIALIMNVAYWFLGKDVGIKLLFSFMVFCTFLYAIYFSHVARTHQAPPEDDPDADQADSAGATVGVFPTESIYPLLLVIGGAVFVFGLVFGFAMWAAGSAILLVCVFGLVRESRG